jgi:hypothetical protein
MFVTRGTEYTMQGSFPPEFQIRNSGSGIPEQIILALE